MSESELLDAIGEMLESMFVFDVVTPAPVWVRTMTGGLQPLYGADANRVIRLKRLYEDGMLDSEAQP